MSINIQPDQTPQLLAPSMHEDYLNYSKSRGSLEA